VFILDLCCPALLFSNSNAFPPFPLPCFFYLLFPGSFFAPQPKSELPLLSDSNRDFLTHLCVFPPRHHLIVSPFFPPPLPFSARLQCLLVGGGEYGLSLRAVPVVSYFFSHKRSFPVSPPLGWSFPFLGNVVSFYFLFDEKNFISMGCPSFSSRSPFPSEKPSQVLHPAAEFVEYIPVTDKMAFTSPFSLSPPYAFFLGLPNQVSDLSEVSLTLLTLSWPSGCFFFLHRRKNSLDM